MKNLAAIILLFSANIVSGIAQGISMIAIPWYFNLQDKMQLFGLVFLLTNVCSLFWVPYSGTLVDKYDRKKVFLAIIAISGTLLGSIAYYGVANDGLPLALVGLAFTITFLNYNIHYPTLYAFLQEITEKRYYGKLSSIIEVQGQFATILAGAVGAFLLEGISGGTMIVFGVDIPVSWSLEAWSIQEIFVLDASTYVLALLLVSLIRYVPLTERKSEVGTIISRFKRGYAYLMANPNILIFGLASYAVFLTLLLTGFYLMAPYVENYLQEGGDVYANMDMFYGSGALLTGITIRLLLKNMRLVDSIIGLTLMMAFSFVGLVLTKSITWFFLIAFVHGICNAGVRVMRVGYLFKYIPNEVFGRAASIFNLGNISARIVFLALFMLPFFYQGENVKYMMIIMAAILFTTVIVFLGFYPRFHKDLVKEI